MFTITISVIAIIIISHFVSVIKLLSQPTSFILVILPT